MEEKDLKNLSRQDLLELLMNQTQRGDELQKRVGMLEQIIRKREVMNSEAGTVADAALKFNGVFESAQKAAEQYVENVKKISEKQQLEVRNLDEYREMKIRETHEICRKREMQTENYVSTVSARVQELFSRYRSMEDDIKRIMMDSNRD